ncbi:MAG: acetylglutamate kinase, partial [Kangiellaceae bacterium]|nr:acetylglutamate kinase [Kangiellaceae bacterium]
MHSYKIVDNIYGEKQNHSKAKETIIQLLSNLANPKEIDQYLERFVNAGKTHFAVIKVGGAVLENDLDNLCSSLAFLEQIGLFPIVVHGAGPQLSLKLRSSGIEPQFIDGQRVTDKKTLKIAKKVFVEQNLKLANKMQSLGVKTASITSGVFTAEQESESQLGLVGQVTQIDLDPITTAIESGAIPILSSVGESESGQILNINADVATNQLAIALKPYKIIFLTETGGILGKDEKIVSSINLVTDYHKLIEQPWLHGGMKLKLQQIAEILSQLPSTASVSITKPAHLAKELFTHKGSGTLLRKGESIMVHDDIETIKVKKLKFLLESSFGKHLQPDYFEATKIRKAFITYCYRAAAIITEENGVAYLDKFVVAEDAKGEGLGKAVWEKLVNSTPEFFWRSQHNNPINGFYSRKADGFQKSSNWCVFWKGLEDFNIISKCVAL